MKIHKSSLVLYAVLFLFVLLSGIVQAATITSTSTGGDWFQGTTWVGNVVPTETDDVIIATTGTGIVRLDKNNKLSFPSITVNAGSRLTILKKNSALTITGSFTNAGTTTVAKGGRLTTGNFTNSGTLSYTKGGNLDLSGSFTNTGTLTMGTATVSYIGTNTAASTSSGFTTNGPVQFTRTKGSVTLTGNLQATTLTVNADGGTLNMGTSLTHTFSGVVTLSNGTFNGGSSAINLNMLYNNAWVRNGGTFTAGTGTVVFSGAGPQKLAGTLTSTFNNLTFSGTGVKTLTTVPVVNGVLSMEGTATVSAAPTYGTAATIQYRGITSVTTSVEFPEGFAGTGGLIIDQGIGNTVTLGNSTTAFAGNLNLKSGTFELSSFTINRVAAGGTLTIAAGAALRIGGTGSLPSNYTTHSLHCTSTVEYAGANQTVANLNSSQTYGNLILSGSSVKTLLTGTTAICGNLTLTGTSSTTAVTGLTVGGFVDIQAGAELNAGGFEHQVGGDWTQNGTFASTGSTVNFISATPATIGSSNFNDLIFSGAGTKVASGSLEVAGNLTISANFSAAEFSHSVAGNWTNNGSFDAGSSSFTFNGSSAQSLTGTNEPVFHQFIQNGSGGVTLGVATTVADTLTLTNGLITLNAYNLYVGSTGDGTAASYVKTNSTGVLTRTVTAGTAHVFPVGNASYNPLSITNTTSGNTDNYKVRVIDGPITNANVNSKTVNRRWQLTEDIAGGSDLTIVAGYTTGETAVDFNASLTPVVAYFTGYSWKAPLAATVSGTGPFTFATAPGALSVDELTDASGFLSLGSGDAFNASKLAVSSISPSSPFLNQANVTITVQSHNSANIPTELTQNTGYELTASNTTLNGAPVPGTLLANTFQSELTNLMFTVTSTTATVTAACTSGALLASGTSGVFTIGIGNIYKPAATGNWSSVQWQISTDGGASFTATSLPAGNNFGASDVVLIPEGIVLTADVASASFYNVEVKGTLLLSSGTLTLNHVPVGTDYGFVVTGTFHYAGGTFINTDTSNPILMQGGTYIHAVNGGNIPIATWSSLGVTRSTCRITGVTSTPIASGLTQNFQHFTWDNASQTAVQTLSGNLTVNGNLTLANGVITTGAANYVIVTAVGSVTSTNNARVHGNFRKYVPNSSNPAVLLPVGDAVNYTPVTVQFAGTTSGSGYLNALTSTAQPPAASALSQTNYINRNWTISNSGIGGFASASLTFNYTAGDKIGSPAPSALLVRKLSGTTWSNTTTGTQADFSTQSTGVLTFGTFAIGEDTCSPTTAVWFGGTSTNWNTASNWCNGTVPTSSTDVIIPAGSVNQPLINTAAACNNLQVETGATLTMSGDNTLSVYGNWTVSGTFNRSTATVVFAGVAAQTITGTTTFNNLTIAATAGVTAISNITVNGVLSLQGANPSNTKGALDMGSNTLYMGASATTIGEGDVTGIIMRSHAFVINTFYSFGNVNSGIVFTPVSGQILPATIAIKVSLGTAPVWNSSNSSGTAFPETPVRRIYDLIQVGGSGTSAIIRVHYNDNEIPVGVEEERLTLWHRVFVGGNYFVKEVGRSSQDIVSNFITIQDVDITHIPSVWGYQQEAIAPAKAAILTWVGGANGAETDWYTPTNWEPAAVPSAEYGIHIPSADLTDGNSPVLPAGENFVSSVLIESGGILNTGANASLKLTGTNEIWSLQAGGVFNAGTSTITVANAADYGSFSGSTDFYNLAVADGARLRLTSGSYTGIKGSLLLSENGILDAATTDNTVEFKGASLQTIPNPKGSLTGYHHLILSGSGTKSLPQDTLYINGDFTNNGAVLNSTAATLRFNGVVNQSIGGSTASVFNNLVIANAAGVTLGNSQTFNGGLELSSGLINTATYTLTAGCDATITNASATSYINGKLARLFCSAGAKEFPLGKGGNYRPFRLNYTALTGTSTVVAEQKEELLPGIAPANTTVFATRYWQLSETGGSDYSYHITLDGSGWTPAGTPLMVLGNGTTNVEYPVTTPDYTNLTAFTSFGNVGLASYLSYITWLGSASDNSWFTPSNWSSASVPASTDDIRIPSSLSYYPVISGVSPTNNVAIADGGKLELSDGARLTVESGPLLTLASGATVTTGAGALLVLQSGARYLNLSAATPTLQMERELTGMMGWRMLAAPLTSRFDDLFASPLVTQGFTGATYPAAFPNLMWWDETDGGTTLEGWRKPSNFTDILPAGRGYFHFIFNGAGIVGGGTYTDVLPLTMTTTGVEQFDGSGDYSYSLSYTERVTSPVSSAADTSFYEANVLDQGWNLIGNPTASTLNWDDMNWTKTNVDNTIYVWDPAANSGNGDYLYWNGTTGTLSNGNIPPFQAFWVHANAASPELRFPNAVKTGATGTFYRSPAADMPVTVSMNLSTRKMQTRSFISFNNSGVAGRDACDAYRLESMNDSRIDLYTLSSPTHVSPLVINNLPLRDEGLVNLPLYVDAFEQGKGIGDEFLLEWELPANWPSDWNISLQDHRTATAISMTDHQQYRFTHATTTTKKTATNALYSPQSLVTKTSSGSMASAGAPPFSIVISKGGLPIDYIEPQPALLTIYPNPVSTIAQVGFSLPATARISMELFDLNGSCVEKIVDAEYAAGISEINWQVGSRSDGMYFVRFVSGDTVEIRKVIIKK